MNLDVVPLKRLADLKDSTSNPMSEIIARGQALSDLAARISNRLANRPSAADANTVPVQTERHTLPRRSNDAGDRRLYIVEPRLQRRPSCLHCTLCGSEEQSLQCPVNPLVQLTASA